MLLQELLGFRGRRPPPPGRCLHLTSVPAVVKNDNECQSLRKGLLLQIKDWDNTNDSVLLAPAPPSCETVRNSSRGGLMKRFRRDCTVAMRARTSRTWSRPRSSSLAVKIHNSRLNS